MIKQILIATIIISSSSLAVNGKLIRKPAQSTVDLAFVPKTNGVSLGIQYAYDTQWMFAFNARVTNDMSNISFIGFSNKETKEMLDDWLEFKPNGDSVVFSESNKKVLIDLFKDMKKFEIVFATNSKTIVYKSDLADLCENYKNNIADMSTGKEACQPGPIAEINNDCDKYLAITNDRVSKGLISCNAAKKFYSEKGCGEFVCP